MQILVDACHVYAYMVGRGRLDVELNEQLLCIECTTPACRPIHVIALSRGSGIRFFIVSLLLCKVSQVATGVIAHFY